MYCQVWNCCVNWPLSKKWCLLFFVAAGWDTPFRFLCMFRGIDDGAGVFDAVTADIYVPVNIDTVVVGTAVLCVTTVEIWILVFSSTGMFSSGMLLFWINAWYSCWISLRGLSNWLSCWMVWLIIACSTPSSNSLDTWFCVITLSRWLKNKVLYSFSNSSCRDTARETGFKIFGLNCLGIIRETLIWWWYLIALSNLFLFSRWLLYSFDCCSKNWWISILCDNIVMNL